MSTRRNFFKASFATLAWSALGGSAWGTAKTLVGLQLYSVRNQCQQDLPAARTDTSWSRTKSASLFTRVLPPASEMQSDCCPSKNIASYIECEGLSVAFEALG